MAERARRTAEVVAAVLSIALVAAFLNRPPVAPHTARLALAPTTLLRLWHRVEACTGRSGDLARVHLRVWTDRSGVPMGVGGLPAEEAFIHATGEIVLAAHNASDTAWVMHGMAHALRGWDDGRHDPAIGARCAHLFRWP